MRSYIWLKLTNVSEEYIASIFRVKDEVKQENIDQNIYILNCN
jgi:hypothetical protein